MCKEKRITYEEMFNDKEFNDLLDKTKDADDVLLRDGFRPVQCKFKRIDLINEDKSKGKLRLRVTNDTDLAEDVLKGSLCFSKM